MSKAYEIIEIPVEDLQLNPDNPRQISKKDFARLVKSLKTCPDLFKARPLLISTRTGEDVILGGNMRYKAAVKLGYKKVPCIVLGDLSRDQEREIAIKDNGAFGEWDWETLANGWDDLPLADWGVDVPEIGEGIDLGGEPGTPAEGKEITCPKCGHTFKK